MLPAQAEVGHLPGLQSVDALEDVPRNPSLSGLHGLADGIGPLCQDLLELLRRVAEAPFEVLHEPIQFPARAFHSPDRGRRKEVQANDTTVIDQQFLVVVAVLDQRPDNLPDLLVQSETLVEQVVEHTLKGLVRARYPHRAL